MKYFSSLFSEFYEINFIAKSIFIILHILKFANQHLYYWFYANRWNNGPTNSQNKKCMLDIIFGDDNGQLE
ncbi:MAG: hypothetical protein A2X25_07295 [Chloroflexi bacterium GWB2_49_20]|nr:MAG: hypothetical protein A2X25_07295 [Chloroflexi bacterium GWB2_49_20]OGN77962.1 MAG: hypothetical protein A2X26_15100 [Chloroflexi bacterium GWC2_49_37]OGN85000.1 MAG: hypothetical protein A2X27_09800 [Chloroflexi bacterium GWD2_49_16]HBG74969.1 hypothetical protein [Anaerolineae bacterium]HCC78307.1 hypothetical protein [Anaerolineae bacterium]